MFCTNCGSQIPDNANVCPYCGTVLSQTPPAAPAQQYGQPAYGQPAYGQPVQGPSVSDRAASAVRDARMVFASSLETIRGEGKYVNLTLADLFSQVPKKHTREESDQLAICGTATTTPDIRDAGRLWMKPWLYSRVLAFGLLVFMGLVSLWLGFTNPIVLPSIMFVGSFLVPLATLIFFFEANAPRDISIVEVMQTFLLGGVLSLVATHVILVFIPGSDTGSLVPAMLTGLIEELGKLVVVAYAIKRRNRPTYVLGGLLLGAAVGAGFAAFESTGYAFEGFLEVWTMAFNPQYLLMAYNAGFEAVMSSVVLRGMLAIGGHVAWAAVHGAAIAIALDGRAFKPEYLASPVFLLLFFATVGLHGFWDWMPIRVLFADQIICVVAVWAMLLVLLRRGIAEVNRAAQVAGAVASTAADA